MITNLDTEGLSKIAFDYDLFYIDIWGVIHNGLELNFSAVETPTWALLLASSMRKYNYSCEILDCDAMRLTDEEFVALIDESEDIQDEAKAKLDQA